MVQLGEALFIGLLFSFVQLKLPESSSQQRATGRLRSMESGVSAAGLDH